MVLAMVLTNSSRQGLPWPDEEFVSVAQRGDVREGVCPSLMGPELGHSSLAKTACQKVVRSALGVDDNERQLGFPTHLWQDFASLTRGHNRYQLHCPLGPPTIRALFSSGLSVTST